MSQSAEDYLDIYIPRLNMQKSGVTDPPEHVQHFTELFVKRLEELNKNTMIKSYHLDGRVDFIVVDTGEVIATLSD